MAPARRTLARWMTALTVNGSPASVTKARDLDLAGEGALVAGDVVGRLRFRILDRQLHMVEAGLGELRHRGLVEADAGGDEVGVEAKARGMGDELDEIAPRRRLAPGKMQLQNAERRGLARRPASSSRCRARAARASSSSGFEQ